MKISAETKCLQAASHNVWILSLLSFLLLQPLILTATSDGGGVHDPRVGHGSGGDFFCSVDRSHTGEMCSSILFAECRGGGFFFHHKYDHDTKNVSRGGIDIRYRV